MPDLRLIGRLDHNFGWRDGRLTDGTPCDPTAPAPATLLGAVASVGAGTAGCHRLLRDPLGLNKLFWSRVDQTIFVAARPRRLVEAGCPFESIRAVPPGIVADLDLARGRARVTRLQLADPPATPEAGEDTVAPLAAEIRSRLDEVFATLAETYRRTRVFVCLSGGLDSSGIGVLARNHFPDAVAVSFDLQRANGYTSDDRRTAERLARDLGLPLLCATATEDDLLDALDAVLVEAVDWRDFNVHAALVNACLAQAIAAATAHHQEARPLVLTGDLMNEFLVDYHAETFRGRVYYRLPRLEPAALRAALVQGLETSHREIGPFESFALPVVQPYAAVADLLGALPAPFLAEPERKDRLNRLMFGSQIPSYVYTRGKTRAQVGDSDGGAGWGTGVLAVCADHGLDQQWLRQRFAELHGVRDARALDRFIRGGRYHSSLPFAEQEST